MKHLTKHLQVAGDGRVTITACDWLDGKNRAVRQYRPTTASRRRLEAWTRDRPGFLSIYPNSTVMTYRWEH